MVIVQKCVFSGSELVSDAFDTTESYEGHIIECQSKMITKGAVQLDIGDADEVDDQDEQVNDVADAFQLAAMTMKKKEFQTYIKTFMGKVKNHLVENNPDRVDNFMKQAT